MKEVDFTTEFRVLSDKQTDSHALHLLAKIYPNPKEIILEQIAYAHRVSLKYCKENECRELAEIFANGRHSALNTDTAVNTNMEGTRP